MHKIASFIDGNLIKECVMEVENDLCPEKAFLFGSISRSASSVVQRTWRKHTATDTEKAENLWYYFVLDESSDSLSTSQLLVFIRGGN